MNLPKWLQGPSSVSTGFSEYAEFTPIESARLKGQLKKVLIGGRQCVLRRKYLFPWKKEEVTKLWLMEGTAEMTSDGCPIRVSLALPGNFEMARHLTMTKLIDAALALRMAQREAVALTG